MSDKHLLNDSYKLVFSQARNYFDKVRNKADTELDGDEFYSDALLEYGKAEYERGQKESLNYISGFEAGYRNTILVTGEVLQHEWAEMESEKKQVVHAHQISLNSCMDYSEGKTAVIIKLERENIELKKAIEATHKQMLPHQEESKEPEWYEADKCLPLPNKNVYIVYKWFDPNVPQDNTDPVEAIFEFKEHGGVFVRYNAPPKPPITHSYPGVILKWRYADENT